MAAFHRLKDVGSQFRLAGQVGLGQSLLHSLNLHQTQGSLIPYRTHRQMLLIADAPVQTGYSFLSCLSYL